MKIFLMNQDPRCTVEPGEGIVEAPDLRRMAGLQGASRSGANAALLQGFVLVLSWE
jgi:ribosome-binding ATPase YchF (GTP1/OBG family)